ncbi:unnamed protein product [Brachionus calyciflorus]|uniref:DUF4209 domain-containing protein n=1 Tax=Brachionus calyciflorus TaxID=104777 RepID=A0A814FDW5_9BILA|nr:unnamed protein product [Brachionus calyciflorus]
MLESLKDFKNFNFESYLSDEVQDILCLNIPLNDSVIEVNNIWLNKLECDLNIDYLANRILIFEDSSSIDFKKTNQNLRGFLNLIKINLIENFHPSNHASIFLNSESDVFFSQVFQNLEFKQCEKKQILNNLTNELAYLSIFPIFERCIGNLIYSLKSCDKTKIPFLLRDLVNESVLTELLGQHLINLVKILFYTPRSLNLRNLSWHGFLNSDQYDSNYIYFLIALITKINHVLKKAKITLKPRPIFNLNKIRSLWFEKNIDLFKNFRSNFKNKIMDSIEKSILIEKSRLEKWNNIFFNFNLSNFSLLTLVLPELEHLLRKLYSIANNLENLCSVQIAFTNEFYLTLDDLLNWYQISSNRKNYLLDTIDKDLCVLIFDLFHYQDGPRLRDHLSHGELDFETIDDFYVEILLFISIKLISSNLNTYLGAFSERVSKNYECNFHPIKILKKEIFEIIENSSILTQNFDSQIEIVSKIHLTMENFKQKMNLDNEFELVVYRYECFNYSICKTNIFKPNELKLVSIFRNILKEIEKYLIKLNDKREINKELMQNKNLRERQRKNLESFQIFQTNFEHFFNLYFRLLFMLIDKYIFAKDLIILDQFYVDEKKYNEFLKILKNNLKLFQNMSSFCDSNKWIESSISIDLNKDFKVVLNKLLCFV